MIIDETESRDSGGFAKWLWAGLALSLLLHLALVIWAVNFRPQGIGEAYYEQIVPRKFKIERVEIDPAALVQPLEPEPEVHVPARPVELPPEALEMESPAINEATTAKPIPAPAAMEQEIPEAPASVAEALDVLDSRAVTDPIAQLEEIRRQIEESGPVSDARPVLPLPTGDSGGKADYAIAPGYSGLDELLGQTGPLEKGTAPIFLPGELLFDYDSAEIKEPAERELGKLGELISRNPEVRFRIEGHTDSFGSAEYNLGLSERRAEEVKGWLVKQMGVNASQVLTVGRGASMLIAPATEDVEGQRFNRRVEIVLEFAE